MFNVCAFKSGTCQFYEILSFNSVNYKPILYKKVSYFSLLKLGESEKLTDSSKHKL